MYIEIDFSPFFGAMAQRHLLIQSISDWAENRQINYCTKPVKDTLRLTFDDDKNYSLFCMTWNASERTNFRVITDLNNRL